MSEMAQGMASGSTAKPERRCLVVDATPSVQAWVDDMYARGCAVIPGVPDGTVVVTVAAVWRAIEKAFSEDGAPWEVRHGWPDLNRVPGPRDPSSDKGPVKPWYCALFGIGCR